MRTLGVCTRWRVGGSRHREVISSHWWHWTSQNPRGLNYLMQSLPQPCEVGTELMSETQRASTPCPRPQPGSDKARVWNMAVAPARALEDPPTFNPLLPTSLSDIRCDDEEKMVPLQQNLGLQLRGSHVPSVDRLSTQGTLPVWL